MSEHAIDSSFPASAELEAAIRTAARALEAVLSPDYDAARKYRDRLEAACTGPDNCTGDEFTAELEAQKEFFSQEMEFRTSTGCTSEDGMHITEVISQFPELAEHVEEAVARQVGPRIGWTAEARDDWGLMVAGIDLDDGNHDFGPRLSDSAWGFYAQDWSGSSLGTASRLYRRETGWDFAPGNAGIWLLMLAPVASIGGGDGEERFYSGHLAGFVICHDRDEDGTYESVGHIWTASAWRRRGIARRLLGEAQTRFGALQLEGPFTDDGAALAKACGIPEDQ